MPPDPAVVTSARACPRDSAPLETRTVAATEVNVCAKCGGMFLDHGEIEKVAPGFHAAYQRALDRKLHVHADTRCPGCGKRMLVLHCGQAKARFALDRCVGCGGTWLDGREIQAAVEVGACVRLLGLT